MTDKLERVYRMPFADIYPLYVNKVERKGRSRAELHQVISWLTGYDDQGLEAQVAKQVDLRAFFEQAPRMNPHANKVTGSICGVRVEQIEDPLMQAIRRMDKLVDELAKGRAMEKILRG